MLNNGQENRTSHGTQHEKGGEAHVVLQEVGEVVVVEEDEEEGDDGDEDDEDQGVEEGAFKLLGCGIGGGLEVDEVGGGADRRSGGGEGIGGRESVD